MQTTCAPSSQRTASPREGERAPSARRPSESGRLRQESLMLTARLRRCVCGVGGPLAGGREYGAGQPHRVSAPRPATPRQVAQHNDDLSRQSAPQRFTAGPRYLAIHNWLRDPVGDGHLEVLRGQFRIGQSLAQKPPARPAIASCRPKAQCGQRTETTSPAVGVGRHGPPLSSEPTGPSHVGSAAAPGYARACASSSARSTLSREWPMCSPPVCSRMHSTGRPSDARHVRYAA